MSFAIRTNDEIHEGTDFGFTLAALAAPDGTALLVTDVSTVDVYVYDTTVDPDTAIYSSTGMSPSAAPAIIVTTAVGDGWTLDSTGRNFRHYLTRAAVGEAKGEHVYRIRYVVHTDAFSGSSGDFGDFQVVRDVKVRALGAP